MAAEQREHTSRDAAARAIDAEHQSKQTEPVKAGACEEPRGDDECDKADARDELLANPPESGSAKGAIHHLRIPAELR
jgi:hypothetical protein